MHLRQHALAYFFALTFAISWSQWILATLGAPVQGGLNPLGPALAAAILVLVDGGWPALRTLLSGLARWRVAGRWYLVVLLLPIGICALAAVLNVQLGATMPETSHLKDVGELPARFLFIFVIITLGEEPGWRGFALPRLMARLSPLSASLLLGVVWACWHLPLTSTELAPPFIAPFLIGITSASVLHAWIFMRTRQSLLLQMLFHATVNTVGGGYAFKLFTGHDVVRMWWIFATLWALTATLVAALGGLKAVEPSGARAGAEPTERRPQDA